MKVNELIYKLSKLNPNSNVFVGKNPDTDLITDFSNFSIENRFKTNTADSDIAANYSSEMIIFYPERSD